MSQQTDLDVKKGLQVDRLSYMPLPQNTNYYANGVLSIGLAHPSTT